MKTAHTQLITHEFVVFNSHTVPISIYGMNYMSIPCLTVMSSSLSHSPLKAVFKRGFRTLFSKTKDFLIQIPSLTKTGSSVVTSNWTILSRISDRRFKVTALRTCFSTVHRGTGKSLIINAVCQQVQELANAQGDRFGVIRVNCQTIKSHDRAVYRLVESAAIGVGVDPGVPESGVSTDQKLNRFYEILSENFDSVIIILDEVDLLVGRQRDPNDEPAYPSYSINSRASQLGRIEGDVSVAALTNDPRFMENLDGRAESSFNPQDIVFPDYDANQLQAILGRRRDAYRDNVLEDGIIPLSSAYAAQDHGDARKAIDLFRKAGEIADRQGEDRVREEQVRGAQKEAERDRTLTQNAGAFDAEETLTLCDRYRSCLFPAEPKRCS